jgi:hypothetical protein
MLPVISQARLNQPPRDRPQPQWHCRQPANSPPPDVCPAGWNIAPSGKPGVYECIRQPNACPPNYEKPKAFVGAGEGYYSCSPVPMPVSESPSGWHCKKGFFYGEEMAVCQPLLVPGLPETAQLPCAPSKGGKLGTVFYQENYKKMGCRAATKLAN